MRGSTGTAGVVSVGVTDVRPATEADLPALVASLEQPRYFADRLVRQRHGLGALLVAWVDGMAVGDIYLRLEGPDEDELADLRTVPLLTHLEVLPAYRKQGI